MRGVTSKSKIENTPSRRSPFAFKEIKVVRKPGYFDLYAKQ